MSCDVKNRRSIFPNKFTACLMLLMTVFGTTGLFGQSTTTSTLSTCSAVPINFVRSGEISGTTYTWSAPTYDNAAVLSGGAAESNPQTSIIQTLTLDINATSPSKATYTVTPSTGASFTLVVTVNPLPVLSSNTATVAKCSGTAVTYSPTSATGGTNITWSRALVSGISNNGTTGQGNINEIINNITTDPIDINYVFALSANGCRNDQAITVTINPTPFLTTTLTPTAICSGETFHYVPQSIFPNTTFQWARSSNSGINNGGTATGTNDPNEQLVNNTLFAQQAVYTYSMTNNSTACVGTQVVRVMVNPVPTVASTNTLASCSKSKFKFSPSTIPNGTLFSWAAPNVTAGSVSGTTAKTNEYYVGDELTNNGATTATVVYTVTPFTFGCRGADFTVTVNVGTLSPTTSKPSLSNSLTPPDICSGTVFNYPAQSDAANPTYSWERFFANGITTTPNRGNTNNPNEVLVNGATFPVPVHYAFTITSNGCSSTDDVVLTVNPSPVLNSSLTPPAICTNTLFSYTPTSLTQYVSFNWTRAVVTGISNSASGNTDNPGETLINTTTSPITVTYVYSLVTVNGCTNNPQSVTVVVNPAPILTSLTSPPAICSGSTFNYPPAANPSSSSITWTRAVLPTISNGAGAGANNPSEILINKTIFPVSVPYTFRMNSGGCQGEQTVTVVVNPTPRVQNLAINSCSGTPFTARIDSVPSGTLYSWVAPTVSPTGSVTGSSAQTAQTAVSQTLNNQTLNPGTVTYTVTPVTGSCTGATFRVVVTVNAVPALGNQPSLAVCSGTPFNFAPGNTIVPAGTTYTWSSPVQSPLNSLEGANAQPISQSSVSQVLSSSNNIPNTATYTVTPSANGCTGNTFTLAVSVNPVPAISNLSDTICSNGTFFVNPSSVPVNTLYTWTTPTAVPFGSVVGSSARTNPAATISQTLVNATNQTGQVIYTVTPAAGNCTGPVFNLTVVVGVPLPFTANQTAQVCSGTAFDVTPSTSRPGTSYTWSVPAITPANSVVGASAASTPQALISQTLTNLLLVTDTVVYTILPYNTGCRGNLFTATVRVLALPKATITGNSVICRYPFDTVNVAFTGIGPWSFDYLNDDQAGTQKGVTTANFRWGVPATGISSRTLQITSIKDLACVNNRDTAVFTQTVNPLPVATIKSLHGTYICNNINDTLLVISNDTALQYQWTHNRIAVPGATTEGLVTLQPGKYNARITNQFGCVDTAGTSVELIYISQPVLAFNFDSYCINTPAHFKNLTDTSTIGLTTWKWDFGDSAISDLFDPTHTYLRGGIHHLKLTATQLFCAAYSTSKDSIIDVQYPIGGITMPSVSTYKGQITPLAVRTIPGYRYRWDPAKGIDKPDSASVNFNLSQTQQYEIRLISPGSCVTTDSLLVRVFDDKLVNIFVPKSFTPNFDGINDVLYPYLAGIKTFNYFKVFNRFGQMMFQTTNYDIGWNGTFNGIQQPMGIYIWVATGVALDGTPFEQKGQVMLLR